MPPRKTTRKPGAKAPKLSWQNLLAAEIPHAELIDHGARFNADRLLSHWRTIRSAIEAHDAAAKAHNEGLPVEQQDDDKFRHATFDESGIDSDWLAKMDSLETAVDDGISSKDAAGNDALPAAAALDRAVGSLAQLHKRVRTVVVMDPTRAKAIAKLSKGESLPTLRRNTPKLVGMMGPRAKTKDGDKAANRTLLSETLATVRKHERAYKTAKAKLSPVALATHHRKGILHQEMISAGLLARAILPRSESKVFAISGHVSVHMPSRKHAPAAPIEPPATAGPPAPK